MKRSIKLAVVAALALGATSSFATNGSTLIGTGAKARGMGGAAIGVSHGAESALANPALISSVKGTEVQFGGTIFMPSVSSDSGFGAGAKDSAADMNVIPAVSLASQVNDNFYWGIGMWGTAGMGVDYREEASNFNMVTNLQLMQFGVPLTYANSGFSLGVTPVLQYGALDINYDGTAIGGGNTGAGVAQDLAFGFNLGAAYEIAGVTIGAVYKSAIDMEYKGQLTSAMAGFFGPGAYTNDILATPAEIGLGVSYEMSGNTIALDYKQIQWSSAKGYEDFGWDDQSVITIGYEYATKTWAARLGYNYAESPISEAGPVSAGAPGTPQFGASVNNALNAIGFPAIVESHIALGGTYNFSEQTSVDLAYVYAPETKVEFEHNFTGSGTNQTVTTTHSQSSLTLGLNYNF